MIDLVKPGTYTVQWTMMVEASGPGAAAEEAFAAIRAPATTASHFMVFADPSCDMRAGAWHVDLLHGSVDELDPDGRPGLHVIRGRDLQ